MDQGFNLCNGDIDELVKASKQLQNKMRQELRRHTKVSSSFTACGEREELPPIWNTDMLNPYVKNVVADYLFDNSNLTSKSVELEVREDTGKGNNLRAVPTIQPQVTKPLELQAKDSVVRSCRITATVGTQVIENQLQDQESTLKKVDSKAKSIDISTNKTLSLASKSSSLEANKKHHLLHKSTIKPSTSMHRFPLQRFSGTSRKNIDFSKEHPDLELDTSSTTLFPRRFNKETNPGISLRASPKNDSINLAAAKVKPPAGAEGLQQETWKEVLLKTRNKEKPHKVLRLKKGVEVASIRKKIPELNVKEPKDFDVIFKPANGLFHLEKQTGRLSKQKQCDFQHFPVMFIRPECQVQRVANISIRGHSEGRNRLHTAAEEFSSNVKYIECTHEEEKLEVRSCSPKVETDAANDRPKLAIPKEENKFFKALDCTEPLKSLSISRDSSSTPKSSPKIRSISSLSSTCSRSSSQVQQCTTPPSLQTSDNDVHHTIEKILSSSDRPRRTTTKDFIKNPSTRRELYVRTDYRKTTATSPPPLPTPQPPPEFTSSITFSTHHRPIAGRRLTTKQEDDNFIEDDFITKIFERIRNDVPNAVQAFKDRNTTVHEALPPESPIKQHQEQKYSHRHQMSAISNASNVELRPNEIEPGLARVQAKRHDSSHSILQMPPPVDSQVTMQSPPVGGEDQKFLLLQQNPLFVQTINRIKSSAMAGDGRIKEDRHKYPTDAEIKRAVKIFLDSLTLDGGGGRKSIIKDDGVRKKLTLPRSELISSGRVTKYISSVSSNTSNSSSSSSSSRKSRNVNKRSNILRCDVPRSSTSTVMCSSESELESDVTVDSHPPHLTKMMENSISEGEVLSIGEI